VYRKLKLGRSGGEVRPGWQVTGPRRFAEPGENRRIFVQGQMCSRLIIVVSIRFQNPAQMCLAQDNAQVRLAYCYSGRSRDLAAVSKRRVHARQDR
jgi:hypothetical protein